MWSTASALGAAVATSNVGLAGRVNTASGVADRALRRRRAGATIWAATDWSSRASAGTVSSTERAGTAVHAPPGQTRTEVTDSSSTPATAEPGIPLIHIRTRLPDVVGSAKSKRVAAFR